LSTNITIGTRAKERNVAIVVSCIVLMERDTAARKRSAATHARGTRGIVGLTAKLKLDRGRDSVMRIESFLPTLFPFQLATNWVFLLYVGHVLRCLEAARTQQRAHRFGVVRSLRMVSQSQKVRGLLTRSR
jgi:hypothetical protein